MSCDAYNKAFKIQIEETLILLKLIFLEDQKTFQAKSSTSKFQLNLLVLSECIRERKNHPKGHRRVENNCYKCSVEMNWNRI